MSQAEAAGSTVIERDLDGPPEVVWQMWTDPDRFATWYGPPGATVPVAEMDVRVGGARRTCLEMSTPGGPMSMWFAGEHLEVDRPRRLVYTETTADADGNPVSPPGAPAGTHPPDTEVRVELHDLDGRTRMVLTHVGVPADSPGGAGWAAAVDKLAERLAGPSS